MQFEDLRVLLRFPWGEFTAGCNFPAAAVLLNLISGFSVCFYKTSVKALTNRSDRSQRFRHVLTLYYPMSGEAWNPEDVAKWLYDEARNPIAHSLAIQASSDAQNPRTGIAKISLTPEQIKELETSVAKPKWLPQTLWEKVSDTGESIIFLSIPTLYWGVWRMLEGLCNDPKQMSDAESLLLRRAI